MPEIRDSLKGFKERANEMGLKLTYEQQKKNPLRYNIAVVEGANPGIGGYALLGLAHHFINRNWAKDINYMFIDKRNICLTFDNTTPTHHVRAAVL